MLDLAREDKNRREYPEVSYAVIGAIVNGLMGIEIEQGEPGAALQESSYVEGVVATTSRLTSQTEWAEVDQVPVRNNDIRLRQDGLRKSTLWNVSGPSLIWKACFIGSVITILVDGKGFLANRAEQHGQSLSCASIPVGSGDVRTAQAVK